MSWYIFGDVIDSAKMQPELKVRHCGGHRSVDQVHVNLLPGFVLNRYQFPGAERFLDPEAARRQQKAEGKDKQEMDHSSHKSELRVSNAFFENCPPKKKG